MMKYQIIPQFLNLEQIQFNEWVTKEFLIKNTQRVSFSFRIFLHNIKRRGCIEVSPMYGKVAANSNVKITVRFTTRKPDDVTEIFHVRVGHFEPVEFKISA